MADNPGGNAALLFYIGPPIVGGVAGYFLGGKHRLVGALIGVGVGIAGEMAYGAYNNAKNQAAVLANTGTPNTGRLSPVIPPTAVTTLQPGTKYVIMAEVPSGMTDVTLVSGLQTAGWSNVALSKIANAKDPQDPNAQAYVAAGTWSGAANAPVPTGVYIAPAP